MTENVYMVQPPGFIDKDRPKHVCKLNKAIYGLKQAPRAWYNELSSFLKGYGFINSTTDAFLFIYTKGKDIVYFLVYVDDLIVTGNNNKIIAEFVTHLSTKFSLKDLGDLNFFLGVKVIRTYSRLFMSQQKYILDMLEKFDMSNAKPTTTPMATSAKLRLKDGSQLTNATTYRQLVGSLQYLSLTRPDISYSINKLSQYMHLPTENHWAHLKKVSRYLKGTSQFGLFLNNKSSLSITAFSDAD